MADDDRDENSNGSDWAYSTSPSSSNADNTDTSTGVSSFSTDPAQNVGDRPLSNWGEEPRFENSNAPRAWNIWHSIGRLFGASRS